MTDERLTEKAIFNLANSIESTNVRNDYLGQVCGDNPELRGRVATLLQMQAEEPDFLEAPAAGVAATIDRPEGECPGTLIGPYKLLEQIGEGGMGVVFVAEQTEPVRRRVALKIIKPGMDTKQVIARFEAERQALAMMDHPHIARVLDVGTTDVGRPYFVMELVRGMPITEYCDQDRLSTRQRLELIIDVCKAVQHAHQKGIIHRDLKPSNVMITLHDGVPVVKVIDFGVAKAVGQQLTDRTVYTALTQLVGTPLYMSPEQAELSGLDIDTRSDVYSLGVLLYELLTGTTPFDKERLKSIGFDEMRRLIREDEPPRPSTRMSTIGAEALSTISQRRSTDPRRISATLRGELDWIVMKALEKDRSRRYESASSLAADIQRYLSDEPVLACPPTAMYRFQKFARKHRPAIATAATIALCLLLGTTVSAWQAVRATTAEAQANANEQKAVANAATAEQKEQEAIKQRDEVKALADKLAAKEQQLQKTLYGAHMNLAWHAWQAGGIDQVEELLQRHRPKAGESDLRGFEWHYLVRLCNSSLLTLQGHSNHVNEAVYSPDGKLLASASADKTVKVWDAQTGKELLTFKGHTRDVRSVAFSPDSKRIASCTGGSRPGSGSGTPEGRGLKVWDAQTGEEFLHVREAYEPVTYSPDGKRLAATTWIESASANSTVKVWDAQTGQELLSWKAHDAELNTLEFSPDGKRMASAAGDRTVKVWDAQTGQETLSLKGAGYEVKFSPDGKRLASAGGVGGEGAVWDAQSGEKILSLKNVGSDLVFSPDGKRLAAFPGSKDKTLRIVDLQTGQEIRVIKGAGANVVYSPDGRRLASCSVEGSADYTVKIWDAEKDQDSLTVEQTSGYNVAISQDGRYMATGEANRPSYDGTNLRLWNPRTGEAILTLKGHAAAVHGVAFSPDGKRLASGGTGRATRGGTSYSRDDVQEVKIWDVQTGNELVAVKGEGIGGGYSVAFSPDGKRVANTRKVWDAATGQELFSLPESRRGFGHCVAFSPDGKYLATGNFGNPVNEVKLWNAQSGEEVRTLQGGGQGIAFSSDGKLLASSVVRPEVKVWMWDVASGDEVFSAKGGGHGVAFSPDGKRLASGGKLWDTETGQELLSLPGDAYGVAFSPDGHVLASSTFGSVKIYDATPLPEKP